MAASGPDLLVWLFAAQAVGLASAVAARRSVGTRGQRCCQALFLGCLGLLAVLTMLLIGTAPHEWLSCGFTLPAMVVLVLWEPTQGTRVHWQS
jgi:hypothetical protein